MTIKESNNKIPTLRNLAQTRVKTKVPLSQENLAIDNVLENKVDTELQHLVTKEYLGQELARMETRIIKWNVGTIIAVAGITGAIVKLIS